MPLTRKQVIQQAKTELRITDETIHTTVHLNDALHRTVADISQRDPLMTKIGLPFVKYTKDIDLAPFNRPSVVTVDTCDTIWTAKSNVTSTVETTIKTQGLASAKHVIAAEFTTGLISTHVITSMNLSSYKQIKFQVRCSATQASGVLQLCLDDTAACASPLETINIPALVADTWTEVEADLLNPASLTAVISVGLNATSNPGAVTLYIDHIIAVGLPQAAIIKSYKVEYPTNEFHNFKEFGDTISVKLTNAPTITAGALTGTITFTSGSRVITGSGSLFTTQLGEGHFICVSTGSRWYKVANIALATSLTIEQPFEEATVADSVGATLYRDNSSCVYLHCGREYTLTDYYSNLSAKMDNVLVLGAVGYAAQAWSGQYVQALAIDGVTKIASATTELNSVQARITQAVKDLETCKGDALVNLASFDTQIGNVSARIMEAVQYLDLGDNKIDTLNVGGAEVGKVYAQYARAECDNALIHIETAKAYLQSSTKDCIDYSAAELNAGNAYLNTATNWLSQVAQQINVAEIVTRYTRWADGKMAEYKRALARLGRITSYETYPS